MKVILDDITTLHVDAIVNAAKNSLLGGGGVDGIIHRVAGPDLLKECRTLHGCDTGDAKITKGYNLTAKHVIHTVGPNYFSADESEIHTMPILLASCYQKSIEVALANHLKSIAFPCISTGIYGYPQEEAAKIAINTCKAYEDKIDIIFCCYQEKDYSIYQNLLNTKKSFSLFNLKNH